MRTLIETFEIRFVDLNKKSVELINQTGNERLYEIHEPGGKTIGELILRSAGAVEQTIGGITRRLWDDPFEWTLPERMQTVEAILAYLDEVETSRQTGFLFIKTDEDLNRSLPAPVEMLTLFEVLTDTLDRAEQYYSRANSVLSSIAV